MKCFQYGFDIAWGNGQGIVFAESEDQAREMIKAHDSYKCFCDPKNGTIDLIEVDTTKSQLFNMDCII
jgi:hypothetical protein